MFVLEVLVGVAVLAAVALLAAGRFDGLAEEFPDEPDVGIPAGRPLRSTDVPRLRFRLAIRGYRMSDVDAAMAAVQETLRMNETQPAPADPPPATPSPSPAPSPSPQPPFEPEPLPPSPPQPPAPEPVPQPEPPLADSAEQPPTDVEQRPLSELEAGADATRGDDVSAGAPDPTSWQAPPSTGV
ncbi:MAG TPA: hypothetical protein VFH66_13435 [Mycobacteriales bacterium]|nr:hypothetical protein [Mycobacteriales bacterium]